MMVRLSIGALVGALVILGGNSLAQSAPKPDLWPRWEANDAESTTVEGEKVSLNDIEHRILRPIWRDNRIHFAVNCASVGCPNLAAEPFTAASIYDWYQADFGGSEEGVLRHFRKYAAPALAASLTSASGSFRYRYDWGLNE